MADRDDETCVARVNGNPEAEQIRAFLAAHDIPCFFRGESLRELGFTLTRLGQVKICVAPEHVEAARELLARAEAGELRLPDEADTGAPED